MPAGAVICMFALYQVNANPAASFIFKTNLNSCKFSSTCCPLHPAYT